MSFRKFNMIYPIVHCLFSILCHFELTFLETEFPSMSMPNIELICTDRKFNANACVSVCVGL